VEDLTKAQNATDLIKDILRANETAKTDAYSRTKRHKQSVPSTDGCIVSEDFHYFDDYNEGNEMLSDDDDDYIERADKKIPGKRQPGSKKRHATAKSDEYNNSNNNAKKGKRKSKLSRNDDQSDKSQMKIDSYTTNHWTPDEFDNLNMTSKNYYLKGGDTRDASQEWLTPYGVGAASKGMNPTSSSIRRTSEEVMNFDDVDHSSSSRHGDFHSPQTKIPTPSAKMRSLDSTISISKFTDKTSADNFDNNEMSSVGTESKVFEVPLTFSRSYTNAILVTGKENQSDGHTGVKILNIGDTKPYSSYSRDIRRNNIDVVDLSEEC